MLNQPMYPYSLAVNNDAQPVPPAESAFDSFTAQKSPPKGGFARIRAPKPVLPKMKNFKAPKTSSAAKSFSVAKIGVK